MLFLFFVFLIGNKGNSSTDSMKQLYSDPNSCLTDPLLHENQSQSHCTARWFPLWKRTTSILQPFKFQIKIKRLEPNQGQPLDPVSSPRISPLTSWTATAPLATATASVEMESEWGRASSFWLLFLLCDGPPAGLQGPKLCLPSRWPSSYRDFASFLWVQAFS